MRRPVLIVVLVTLPIIVFAVFFGPKIFLGGKITLFNDSPMLAQAGPRVVLDGRALNFDVPPVVQDGRTLVPMRAVFEALGAQVGWDEATRTVTAAKGGTEIKLTLGGMAFKNGSPVGLDVPARLVNGRTMVPLRFVSEALGCQVAWDGATRTVAITSGSGPTADTTVGRVNFTKAVMGNSRLPILMFHTVNRAKPKGGLDPYWEWSFRELIDRMYREGYRTITAREAYDFNIRGVRLPEKSIWLTFDDGWEDNLTFAAPILAEYGYVATIFVETSKIGGYLRLNSEQIATLRDKYRWDIQLHGHVGHQPIPINSEGKKGSFYNDLKWLQELSRMETMEERHARVKADLESCIKIVSQYNTACCFAYPSSLNGATPEIRADNDRVLDELGIMGVNVGKTGGEQIVPLNTTSRHNLCRLGIAGDTTYDKIFNIQNFGIFVLLEDSSFDTRFPVYDSINDRFVIGTTDGRIMTVGKNWIVELKPIPVQKPPGSGRPEPKSHIVPSILSNGDIWVGSVSGSVLYRLDLKDLTKPALREISLTFSPHNVVNDGTNLYAFDTSGVVKKIDLATGEASIYCTLPNSGTALYTGSVLNDGKLYTYDSKRKHIVKYDFVNKKLIKYISWEPSDYQLQPWYVIDDNNILTYCNKNLRHVILEYN